MSIDTQSPAIHPQASVDALNPLLVLRKELDLSQTSMGQAIDVSEQYIRRLEQGLVSAPKGALSGFVWSELKRRGQTDNDINRFINRSVDNLSMHSTYPAKLPIRVFTSHDFESAVDYWWEYWLKVKREHAAEQIKPTTVYGFCKALALHPYIVQNYLRNSKKALAKSPLPLSIMEAISQTPNKEHWLGILRGLK